MYTPCTLTIKLWIIWTQRTVVLPIEVCYDERLFRGAVTSREHEDGNIDVTRHFSQNPDVSNIVPTKGKTLTSLTAFTNADAETSIVTFLVTSKSQIKLSAAAKAKLFWGVLLIIDLPMSL